MNKILDWISIIVTEPLLTMGFPCAIVVGGLMGLGGIFLFKIFGTDKMMIILLFISLFIYWCLDRFNRIARKKYEGEEKNA